MLPSHRERGAVCLDQVLWYGCALLVRSQTSKAAPQSKLSAVMVSLPAVWVCL
jgi:hypothetical protein